MQQIKKILKQEDDKDKEEVEGQWRRDFQLDIDWSAAFGIGIVNDVPRTIDSFSENRIHVKVGSIKLFPGRLFIL